MLNNERQTSGRGLRPKGRIAGLITAFIIDKITS